MNFPWSSLLGGIHARQDAAERQAEAVQAARSAAIRQAAGPDLLDAAMSTPGRQTENEVWVDGYWQPARSVIRAGRRW